MSFETVARVDRLTDVEGGPVTGYSMDLRVHCVECGLPFRFLGLPAGHHFAEPRISVDGEELRAPLELAYAREVLGMPLVSGNA